MYVCSSKVYKYLSESEESKNITVYDDSYQTSKKSNLNINILSLRKKEKKVKEQ